MNAPNTNRLIAAALFAMTAAGIAYYPTLTSSAPANPPPPSALPTVALPSPNQPVVEAVFVLDTTGSMGGLIQAAKDKIWSIASTLADAKPAPIVRMGLVAYRDRGDDYVTRVVDLSPDLDSLHAQLFQLQAQGGGDGPESVNQALEEAVTRIGWSKDPGTYRAIFLVGDAPPHMDYQDDVPYSKTLERAHKLGIRVNAIQCGQMPDTAEEWKRIAQLGDGSYFRVDQGGGAVAIATPYDAPLAKLSDELDRTRIYYGKSEERAKRETRDDKARVAASAAAPAVLARKAEFAASDSAKAARKGDKDLVEAVQSGSVDVESLPASELPAPLAKLEPKERSAAVQQTAAEREALRKRIQDLADQREAYLKDKVKAAGGAKDSLDHQIWSAVRKQGADAGISYGNGGPKY
jgi:uncharacterized protein YegL